MNVSPLWASAPTVRWIRLYQKLQYETRIPPDQRQLILSSADPLVFVWVVLNQYPNFQKLTPELFLSILAGLPDTEIMKLGRVAGLFRRLVVDVEFWILILRTIGVNVYDPHLPSRVIGSAMAGNLVESTYYLRWLYRRTIGQWPTHLMLAEPGHQFTHYHPGPIIDVAVLSTDRKYKIMILTPTTLIDIFPGRPLVTHSLNSPVVINDQTIQRPHLAVTTSQILYVDENNITHYISKPGVDVRQSQLDNISVNRSKMNRASNSIQARRYYQYQIQVTEKFLRDYDQTSTVRTFHDPNLFGRFFTILRDRFVKVEYVEENDGTIDYRYGETLLDGIVRYQFLHHPKMMILLRTDRRLYLLVTGKFRPPENMEYDTPRIRYPYFATQLLPIGDEVIDFNYSSPHERIEYLTPDHRSKTFSFITGSVIERPPTPPSIFQLADDSLYFDYHGRPANSDHGLNKSEITELISRYNIDEAFHRGVCFGDQIKSGPTILTMSPRY